MNEQSIASQPANLALRFMLEIGALLALGYRGWQWGRGSGLSSSHWIVKSVTLLVLPPFFGHPPD